MPIKGTDMLPRSFLVKDSFSFLATTEESAYIDNNDHILAYYEEAMCCSDLLLLVIQQELWTAAYIHDKLMTDIQ